MAAEAVGKKIMPFSEIDTVVNPDRETFSLAEALISIMRGHEKLEKARGDSINVVCDVDVPRTDGYYKISLEENTGKVAFERVSSKEAFELPAGKSIHIYEGAAERAGQMVLYISYHGRLGLSAYPTFPKYNLPSTR